MLLILSRELGYLPRNFQFPVSLYNAPDREDNNYMLGQAEKVNSATEDSAD